MILIAVYALFISKTTLSSLLTNSSIQQSDLSLFCHSLIPSESHEVDSLNALICAEKITDQNLNFLLSLSGLIHIFIVSGSQLSLLIATLEFIKFPKFIRLPVLFLYSSLLNWQAPLLRGLSEQVLRLSRFCPRKNSYRKLLAGSILLIFMPNLLFSRSFVMSWVAALSSGLIDIEPTSFKAACKSQLYVYLGMAPLLFGFAPLHPISVLCNLLLAPLIGFVIFPFAVLSCCVPSLVNFFDSGIQILREGLQLLAPLSESPAEQTTMAMSWCWIYLVGFQTFCIWRDLQFNRKRS